MSTRTATTSHRSGRTTSLTVVLLAFLTPIVIVIAAVFYVVTKGASRNGTAELNQRAMLHMTGLNPPTVNRLHARFSDRDGDLIADSPVEQTQFIDPPTIRFSFVATAEPEIYQKAWQPFVDHLSKVTGRPVEYVLFDDAKTQLRALRDGTLHVTGLNSGSVPTAVNVCGFVPIVTLPSPDGSGTASMDIITPARSNIVTPEDIRGRELTLTEPGSNSGYKAPLVLLRSDAGLDPGRDYTIRYSGSHDRSIEGIVSGEYELAAVTSDLIERALKQNRLKRSDYRVVFRSERFPTAGLGYLHNLKPELAITVRKAFHTFDWSGTSLESEIGVEDQPSTFPVADYKEQWSLIRRIDDASGTVHEVKD
ncbi:MAG TPA: phosphate/phosphite/phosphonate ABC transporter substrate-binding protein [Tepidisphaeraceae bacterium]|jgi:phosphonate transport system substrate-binding protein|nr:phosphate/phosphite/phosphonate ABC transporter substrate-binding protein [Tepidisphaeraceae bacterium]